MIAAFDSPAVARAGSDQNQEILGVILFINVTVSEAHADI